MKRQNSGLRRLSEESEQNQVSENKRLKVRHQKEGLSYNLNSDTDSGSSSDESNINGPHASKNSMTQKENSCETIFENSELNNSQMNNSSEIAVEHPEYKQLNVPQDNLGENHLENDGSLQQQQHTNGFRTDSDENNSLEVCINLNNLPNNIVGNDSSSSVLNQENSVVENGISLESNKVNNTDFSPSSIQPEVREEQLPCTVNLNDFNKDDKSSDTCSLSKILPEEPTDEHSNTETVQNGSSSAPYGQNASYPDPEEGCSSNWNSKPSPSTKSCIDIENITMSQLTVTELEGHADVVFSVAADDDFVLSSSGDTTVKVWNVEEKQEMCNFAGHRAAVSSVVLLNLEQSEILRSKLNCFLPEASRIAISASFDCLIKLWSVSDGTEILSMYTFNSITCMGYLEDLMYVVIGTEGGKLEVWDLQLQKIVNSVFAHDSSVSSLEVHDCYVYSASKDGAVKVWLFDEGELQPLYTRRRKETNSRTGNFGSTHWKAISVHNDMLFLGDNTSCLKVLNWRIGRLRLLSNQPDEHGICEAVLAKHNILLTSFYDSGSDTGGINVWKLPGMTYLGTMTGDLQEICSLDVTQSKNKLRIVSGGHQLLVWDYDFSKPPVKNSQDAYFICEVENVGSEIEENLTEMRTHKKVQPQLSNTAENKNSWCNIS